MNDFQARCWSQCEDVLRHLKIAYEEPRRVDGKRETYFSVQLSVGGDAFELFIYSNEAGLMINSTQWTIFEAPDFDRPDQLIDAYTKYLAELLAAAQRSKP